MVRGGLSCKRVLWNVVWDRRVVCWGVWVCSTSIANRACVASTTTTEVYEHAFTPTHALTPHPTTAHTHVQATHCIAPRLQATNQMPLPPPPPPPAWPPALEAHFVRWCEAKQGVAPALALAVAQHVHWILRRLRAALLLATTTAAVSL